MKKSICLLGIGSIVLFLSNHNATARSAKKESQSKNIELINNTTPEKGEHYFLFLKASYQQAHGMAAKSLKTYQHLLRFNPSSQAYTGFLQLLSDIGQHKAILKIYEANHKAFTRAFAKNIALN